jgi:sortase (surface protein transpeptidase)
VLLDIPAVGLSTRVVPIGLNPEGEIQVPSPSVAGWYRLGPAPGGIGPAVIVGHVDTYTGPAVFYRLTGVRAGDIVDVVRADGSRSRFVISAVTRVKKAAFPSRAVFAPTKEAAIRLITCTGAFNPNTRHYVDSFIAWGVATV